MGTGHRKTIPCVVGNLSILFRTSLDDNNIVADAEELRLELSSELNGSLSLVYANHKIKCRTSNCTTVRINQWMGMGSKMVAIESFR